MFGGSPSKAVLFPRQLLAEERAGRGWARPVLGGTERLLPSQGRFRQPAGGSEVGPESPRSAPGGEGDVKPMLWTYPDILM